MIIGFRVKINIYFFKFENTKVEFVRERNYCFEFFPICDLQRKIAPLFFCPENLEFLLLSVCYLLAVREKVRYIYIRIHLYAVNRIKFEVEVHKRKPVQKGKV
jgi:hypothetical protein